MPKTTFLLLILLLVPGPVRGEDLLREGELLTLDKCLAIAEKRQPALAAAEQELAAAQARVGQARAGYYPELNGSAGWSRSSPAGGAGGPINQTSAGVSLSQILWDFGRTSDTVSSREASLESFRQDLWDAGRTVRFNVCQAYYGFLKAQRNRAAAAENLAQYERNRNRAKELFETGLRPKFDVTKAEVDLSNARLALIAAENGIRTARSALNDALGIPGAPEYQVEDNLSFAPLVLDFDQALARAISFRPDLLALKEQTRAAELSVALAKKEAYPTLTGHASLEYAGSKPPLSDGWNVGISLSVPLFSGFSTRYRISETRAVAEALRAREESLRQSIYLEVQQAYLALAEAHEKIPAAELAVRQAQENLDLANGRYAAGVGSPLEVSDAEAAYFNQKTAYNVALYDHKIAQASLEKAMGGR